MTGATVLALETWSEIRADVGSHWLVYLSMPLTAAAIGYLTKLLAIEMLYRPLEFKGVGPIGWQGLVSRRAAKVAAVAMETLTRDVLQPRELLDRIDPEKVVADLEGLLQEAVGELGEELVNHVRPGLWDALPEAAQRRVLARARARAPQVIGNVLDDVRNDMERVVDVKFIAVNTLVRNKATLNHLMRTTAGDALGFMRRAGIWFGLAIGLVQMTAWAVVHNVWIMPLFGFVTGFVSDWIALRMLFRPRTPKRYLGVFRWQGMLHSRREQITADYARVIATDLFAPAVMLEAVLDGPGSDRLFAMVQREVQQAIDDEAGVAQPLVELAVGSHRYRAVKHAAAERVIARLPDTARQVEQYAAETLAVEETIAEKMSRLDTDEYEGILRPVFKDDEWLIVTIGAILGFLVGELQVTLVTHLGGVH